MSDPFKPIGSSPRRDSRPLPNARVDVRPVPAAMVESRPKSHPQLGTPSHMWEYRDGDGQLLGFICRFDPKAGKEFRPLCAFREADGSERWRWEAWRAPRPLYGLDRLAKRPDALVIVTEGEKAADAAQQMLPDAVAVTSPNGAKGAGKADWSVLAGRNVVIWPDNDEPGESYLAEVAARIGEAGGARIRRISPAADNRAAGWDAGDALAEKWTRAQAEQFIGTAHDLAGGEPSQSRRAPRQRDQLLAAADAFELWHSPEQVCYATCQIGEHLENWPLESNAFKRILAGSYYDATGNAPSAQLLADGIRVLEVGALRNAVHKPFCRVGHRGSAELWVDLCDDTWRAVRIAPSGWTVEDRPAVKFTRTATMQALPEPEAGGMIESLRGFINAGDTDFQLIVGWVIAAMWGRGTTFPVLAIGGEQGSGKSTVSRLLRLIVDPSAVTTTAPPKDERDLFMMANNAHVMAFDNLSKVDAWLSDAICRIATGGGFMTRKLHTDFDASWFHGSRPVLINGIPSLTDRADLADRSLTVRLDRIESDERMTEVAWWARWHDAWPGIFGALLDALAGALGRFGGVILKEAPRMADLSHLMAAAEPALGWEVGTFETAYAFNRRNTSEAVFEGDPIAGAIDRFMRDANRTANGWEGTATDLLHELGQLVSEDDRRSRFWPAKPNALGNAVDRSAPVLRNRGIRVRKHHTATARLIRLTVIEREEP